MLGASLVIMLIDVYSIEVDRNLKKITLSAYQWLSENYQHGDRIFLFGNIKFNVEHLTFN